MDYHFKKELKRKEGVLVTQSLILQDRWIICMTSIEPCN